ncbi:GHKL domain-containing protein [Companilactobacillus huachuanensis]|uniref:GHKL domain-containing protein n=1 Tax=Companilactobacillus huachuanensis TaxID=2559914 RepID=A0ABW1RJZ6_9LACO|nr:GHKL domain-containing protein [Companilactobacillus huachuanensis]
MIYIGTKALIIETVISRLFFLFIFMETYNMALIPKEKKPLILVYYFLLLVIDFFMTPFMIFAYIFILYKTLQTKKNDYYLLTSILISLLVPLIAEIISSIVLSPIYASITNLNDAIMITSQLSLQLLGIVIFNYIFHKRSIINIFRNLKSWVPSLIGIYSYAILISFIYFIQKFKAYTALISGILIFLFIQFIVVIYLFIYTYNRQKENFEKKLTNDQLENLSQYTAQLDADQKEMHKFKHDYRNILNSLNEIAIADDNIDLKKSLNELEGYSSKYFSNISMDDFKDLEYVSNTYIKSLLLGKFKIMKANNINCYFECKSNIAKVSINIFDLIRIMGVSIDNAIEAVKNQKKGKIKIILINSNDQLDITIKNTITKNIQLTKIENYGFTTKNNHSGLGLVNIQDIKKKYQNLLVHYDIIDNLFSINFVISNKGELK